MHEAWRWMMAGVVVMGVWITSAAGQDDALPVALADQRWSELSYGVSLRPPRDSRIVERHAQDAMVEFSHGLYSMGLVIREMNRPLDIAEIAKQAIDQVALLVPAAVLLSSEELELAGRPAVQLYLRIPTEDGAWVMGQAIMRIDPQTIAVLRMEAEELNFAMVRPLYEAVVASMEVASPRELDERRDAQIQRGVAWREGLDPMAIHAALREEQWYRVTHEGKDVGYMRMRSYEGELWEMEGIHVDVDVRIDTGNQRNDTESRFFLSEDGVREFWSTKTAVRPKEAPAVRGGRQAIVTEQLWVETGLRSDTQTVIDRETKWANVISIDRKTPSAAEQHEWEKPPQGYLSQVEVQLLGSLLPRHEAAEYGFYAYSSSTGTISYRVDRVEPQSDGSYKVYSRPSPTAAVHVSHYDASGQLLSRTLPSGMQMHPTTPDRIQAIWRTR